MDSQVIKSIMPGSFIASTQHLLHQDFTKSVILITGCDGKTYSGVKINQIIPNQSDEKRKMPVYNGGNIAKKTANLIHSADVTWPKTKFVTSKICMTNVDKNNIDILVDTMPAKCIIVYGFVSWPKNRLEEELQGNWWMPISGNDHMIFAEIFTEAVVNRWYRAYDLVSTTPDCVSVDIGRG